MLLTLKPPLQNGFAAPHAYSTPPPTSTSQSSPTATRAGSFPPLPASTTRRMSTPLRGLPPPAAMTMQNADRGPPPVGQPLGQLPAPPAQWQGADESMRNWLQAKAEEDKRKQEEERTRQESLRLEQRKIEQTMLRESLQGGVPPYMVPMVFAGMGGGNLPNASLEWAQHYMAQISLQQQQQQLQQQQQALPQQTPPELRRDSRMITGPQPNPYATQQPIQQVTAAAPVQAGQQLPSQPQQSAFVHSYQLPTTSPATRTQAQQLPVQVSGPTSAPRPPPQSQLPRLNTNELRIQQPPQASQGVQLAGQTLHPLQQAQSAQQEQPSSSPNIFLHWMPPTSQAGSNQPMTPSGKSQQESPFSQSASSHLRSDYAPSPKKRKTGTSSQPQETSPSFSQTSSSSTPAGRRGGHSRQRSDASNRGYDTLGRPTSRQRQPESASAPSSGQMGSTSQQTPATTVSEDQNRQPSAQPETHRSRYSAGPEMRRGHESSDGPKDEESRS
ncbi:MAG: hypothetical protein M1830_009201 [Pleopsidium flavum]|nr:MAG: hypothetical protein M1830_009201 [Pleopsidium flavum]